LDLRNCYSKTVASAYWINPQVKSCEICIIYFWREIGYFLAWLTLEENAGMHENLFMMDYEYQEKKRRKSTSGSI
jgi:hypothetical protein